MKGDFKVKGTTASGMVLQRNKINCIYGTAEVYSDVILTFRGITSITQSDDDGNWKLEFSPGEAGGPFEMTIQCDDKKIEFNDIYVGEVWVSSGQSNAQLPMERMKYSYPDEFLLPENPNIRMITIPIAWSYKGEQDSIENPKWICAGPQTLGQMSGTAYFFAKKLSEELKVPVGIINASQGGSPITSWLSKEALEEMGDKKEYLEELKYLEDEKNLEKEQKEALESQQNWYAKLNADSKMPDLETDEGWQTVKIPNDFEVESAGFYWFKKEIELKEEQIEHFKLNKARIWLGTIVDADTVYINGTKVGETAYCYPPRRYDFSSDLLKAGKNLIAVRVQINHKDSKIRFYKEKPYFLATENVNIVPTASRNIEIAKSDLEPVDGEIIPLSGDWKMKQTVKVEDMPAQVFFEWKPTALYNSMLAPCFKQAIAGVLWYQGESNAAKYAEYKSLLVKLISVWRKKFMYGSKNLPFVIMQLPNWSDGNDEDSSAVFSDWALLREAQAETVEMINNTALAVTIDAGEWNDLHPEKKKTCGTRAANEALRVAYGKSFIPPSPKFDWCKFKRFKHIVHFNCENTTLFACNVDGIFADLSKESKDGKIYGFSLLCERHGSEFNVDVSAKLKNGEIIEVSVPLGCGKVKELRYLWAQSPVPINLYTRGLMPVGPFRIKL